MTKKLYNILIRQVQSNDFDDLYSFWERVSLKLNPYEEEKAKFSGMVSLNPDLCFILINEDKICGSILGGYDGRSASVHRLAVEPELQNKKYGSLLLKRLEEKLKEKGIKKVALQIHVSNAEVAGFYKKLGYKEMDYVSTLYKDL